jgi:hypothetical protein
MAQMSDQDDELELPVRTKRGHLLTAADIDALATEAETGYDLSRGARQYVGRPSLDAGISPRVSFRMARGLYDAARARAEREGRSVSAIAREAMERYIGE